MIEFNLEEVTMINAEVACRMRECYNDESKVLVAYILLNTYSNSYKQKFYADAIKKYLTEEDYGKVIAETSFGKFDNLTFWVNKTIKDIEEYCLYSNRYEQKSFMEDAVKGAFCTFLYIVFDLNQGAAMELLAAIKKSDILKFLVPISFFMQQKLKNIIYENENKTEDERYLDLLEFEFAPCELFDVWKSSEEEETRSSAIEQKKNKRENPEIVSTQMSFKHLFKH